MFECMASLTRLTSSPAWTMASYGIRVLPEGALPAPSWAPGRLLKKHQRTPMGKVVPRRTLSLCAECNRKAVEAVIRGQSDVAGFRERPGIIDAEILEEGGRILMRKACETHGPFEDLLSNHADYFQRMEAQALGDDFDGVV